MKTSICVKDLLAVMNDDVAVGLKAEGLPEVDLVYVYEAPEVYDFNNIANRKVKDVYFSKMYNCILITYEALTDEEYIEWLMLTQ